MALVKGGVFPCVNFNSSFLKMPFHGSCYLPPPFFYFNLWPIVVKIGTGYPFDVSCDPIEQNWIKINN